MHQHPDDVHRLGHQLVGQAFGERQCCVVRKHKVPTVVDGKRRTRLVRVQQ